MLTHSWMQVCGSWGLAEMLAGFLTLYDMLAEPLWAGWGS